VVLGKDFIAQALKGFSAAPRIGMVSGKILRMDGITLDSTGLFFSVWGTAKERGYGIKDKGRFEKPGFVFGVTGAAALYRREMLEDIKEPDKDYFDPDFRFFYEDLDVAWRAQRRGWKAYYIPQAVARHARGASLRPGRGTGRSYARRYLADGPHADLIKNRYLVVIKNEPLLGFLLRLPCFILYELALWGYILFFRVNLLKAFFFNLKYIKAAFKKRLLSKKP
jgi:GT2 family glycosyltransferase